MRAELDAQLCACCRLVNDLLVFAARTGRVSAVSNSLSSVALCAAAVIVKLCSSCMLMTRYRRPERSCAQISTRLQSFTRAASTPATLRNCTIL